MKMRLFATTAISVVLATAAFGQAPTNAPANSATPPPTQNQPSSTTSQSTTPPASSTAPSTSAQSGQTSSPSTTSTQNSPAGSANPNAAQSAGSSNPGTATSQAPAATNTPAQAQTAPASPAPTQQSNNPASVNSNQAQQAPGNTGAAPQQPNSAGNTAQSSSTNVNASVNINDQQRTRISQSVARLDVRPLGNVNFSLSVGTAIPRDVHLSTLPADVVEIVPQYRGYSFVVVKDEIVIVEPSTYKIVATLPYSGRSTATAPARERSKVSFSDRDREVIRKHAKTRTEGRTTGSAARTEIRVGERVPDTVEIEALPDEVYRESPRLREYRYIHRDSRSYVVDPRERTIIEEID